MARTASPPHAAPDLPTPGGLSARAETLVWRNRFRLALALALSLAGHAWLAGGLARVPLRLASDAEPVAVVEPPPRPQPRDFDLALAAAGQAPAAHEQPLDLLLEPRLSPATEVAQEAANIASAPPLAVAEEVVPALVALERPVVPEGRADMQPTGLPRESAAAPMADTPDFTLELPAVEASADTAPEMRPVRRQPPAEAPAAATARETAIVGDAPLPLVVRDEIAAGGAGMPAHLAPRVSRRGPVAVPEAVVGGPPGRAPTRIDVSAGADSGGAVPALPSDTDPPPAVSSPAPSPTGSLAALGMRPAARPGRAPQSAAVGAAVTAPRGPVSDEEPLSVESVGALSRPGVGGGDRLAVLPLAPAPLPRGTAVVLPPEGRVRSIARPYAGRAAERRGQAPIDRVVDRGLAYLARSQRADGSWTLAGGDSTTAAGATKLKSDTAATGLALLSFLGAGYDHFDGPHHDTVRRGLEWLMRTQRPDGDLYVPADPLSDSCAWLYSHAIGTMALCEAVGMTGDPLIRPAAERACGFIAASQHPERGGWRYTPRSDADLSVSGWMLVALRSGQLAGIAVDPQVLERVRTLLATSTLPADAAAAADIGVGRYVYNIRNPQQRPSQLSTACMTALGTLMRLHTGAAVEDPAIREAAAALAAFEPAYGTQQERRRDAYLWYYASQVLVHTGGDGWERWYAALCRLLDARQERNGPLAGSWDPLGMVPDRWGSYGGRTYVTALHLLALEVPYRHLPTYDLDPGARPTPEADAGK